MLTMVTPYVKQDCVEPLGVRLPALELACCILWQGLTTSRCGVS